MVARYMHMSVEGSAWGFPSGKALGLANLAARPDGLPRMVGQPPRMRGPGAARVKARPPAIMSRNET